MAYDLRSLRIRREPLCSLFLVAAFGLAACGGAGCPPPSGCASCADQSASGAARAAVLAGDTQRERAVTRSATVEDPRTQRALTQGQVASRMVRLPVLPASDRAERGRALAGRTVRRPQTVALSRAMAVRAYLLEQDVDLDQMDVRAFGERVETGSADRVDIVTAGRPG